MKIFFFPVFPLTPHLETEFELILNHLFRKDQVFLLRCNSELKRCLINPFRLKYICILCKSRVNQGLKLINFPEENIIKFPQKIPVFDFLPKYFKDLTELMDFTYDNYEFGRTIASNLLFSSIGNYKLNTIEHRERIKDHLNNAIFIYLYLLEIFKKIKPDIVYIFNGRFDEPASVIQACKKLNIQFFTHEIGDQLNRYCLFKNTIPHEIDYVTKEILDNWEKGSKEKYKIGEKWYYERRYGLNKGIFRYNKYQKRNLLPDNYDKNKRIITIFNSTLGEYFSLKEYNNTIYKDEIEGIHKITTSLQNEPDILLYLRIHPHLSKKNNPQMQELKEIEKIYKNLYVIPPESKISSYDLMEHSDIIITFGSTIGIESVFWNKPSILLGKMSYENLDAVYKPKSHEELIDMIRTNITPKSREGALKFAYWQKTCGIPFKFFNQISLISGLFLGKKIYPPLIVRIYSTFIRLFEIKNLSDIKNIIKRNVNFIIKILFKNQNRDYLWL